MPGRQFVSSSTYRYGINTQEKDIEIGEGIYTAGYWEYDSRLGKRWNVDPIVKTWESPYACFANNPVWFSDPTGQTAGTGGDGDGDDKNKGSSTATPHKLTGSKNLIVFLDDALPVPKDKMEPKGSKWDYVVANTIAEAHQILEKTYGTKGGFIDNLVIRSHGSEIDGHSGMLLDREIVDDPNKADKGNADALKYIRGLTSDKANILLTACGACRREDSGLKLGKFFVGTSNRTLFTNNTNSSARTQPDANGNKAKDDPHWFRFDQFLVEHPTFAGFKKWSYSPMLKKITSDKVFYDVKVNSQTGTFETKTLNIPFMINTKPVN